VGGHRPPPSPAAPVSRRAAMCPPIPACEGLLRTPSPAKRARPCGESEAGAADFECRPDREAAGAETLSPTPTIVLEEWEASMMRRFRKHKARYGVESPEAQAEISEAAASPLLAEAVGVLTAASSPVRGCKIEPARPFLQALRDRLGWTPGWDDTRPSEALARAKIRCKLDVLLTYRQPKEYLSSPDAGRVAMYDFLCDDVFGMPTRSVGAGAGTPQIQLPSGSVYRPTWLEAVQGEPDESPGGSPVAFRPNPFPYQVAPRSPPQPAHLCQQQAQHWVLWYFHRQGDPLAAPTDEEIDRDLRRELLKVVNAEGFSSVDYIFYRNPEFSVADMFHVQVFWIVPPEPARRQ